MNHTERYGLTWKERPPTWDDVIKLLPEPPHDLTWMEILQEEESTDEWENLEQDLQNVSKKFPGVLFKLEITNLDEDRRHVQYHRDGFYYEAKEIRHLPDFDESKLEGKIEKLTICQRTRRIIKRICFGDR